ncbi:dUTP diphosphatase [Marinilabiliaceae bacterium ANBcel2]|nr:dUTP diphosphatase [Marinilabiliaceae bacterium ANBcel2]
MIDIKVVNKSDNDLPIFSTSNSAGVDIRAFLDENILIKPGERVMIPTGLFIELPSGYEAHIRPRSGLAIKNGITVLNSPGTIDADYRGEIKVILINHSKESFTVNSGDRICQMVINKFESFNWISSESLSNSDRGEGGFGHSGIN